MKKVFMSLMFAGLLTAGLTSCKNETPTEQAADQMEETTEMKSDSVEQKSDMVKDSMETSGEAKADSMREEAK
ncbi:MAG TPA: hypothetical protein PK076_00135 [Saprospiraceae bacterium]|nr:hypothetical protein [Saprospiraceae bacterium]HQW54496.1 hypothetical protein [Saprospiraceae bacterium]